MKKNIDQADIIRKLLDCENKYNFFDIITDDIQIYPLIRMGIFYEILKNLNIYEPQPKSLKINKINSILILIKKLFNNFKISKIKNHKIAIIEHPRRIDGSTEDIYTSFLYDIFPNDTLTIKHPIYGKIITDGKTKYDSYHYDNILIKKKLLKFIYFKNKYFHITNKISKIINKEIDKNHDYFKFIEGLIIDKIISCKLAKIFLSKYNFECLIVVNGYGFNHFVLAAKQLGIEVIELQHGNIYDTHLGYHYPNSKVGSIDSFPDYLLTFGKYWNNQAKFPIPKNCVKENGFYFFEQSSLSNKVSGHLKKNKILVISQQNIGRKLSYFTMDLAKKLTNYQFIFKPHPKEILNEAEYLNELKDVKNITISRKALYKLYPTVEFQIGVFSTAIYEGLGHSVKTIIYKINGWKVMSKLENYQGVKFAKDINHAIDLLINDKFQEPELNIFFNKDVLENHLEFFKLYMN